MNEHQHRLWKGMLDSIENYLKNENQDFCNLVGDLEGALDASEFKNSELINEWFDFWTPLEIRRSIEGNKIDKLKAKEELMAMKTFLEKHL